MAIKKNQTLYDVATNQTIKLNENEATLKDQKSKLNSQTVFSDVSDKNLLEYSHNENLFNDFNRERLIPYMISREGPAIAIADVNGDNINDVFIGSPSFQKSNCL